MRNSLSFAAGGALALAALVALSSQQPVAASVPGVNLKVDAARLASSWSLDTGRFKKNNCAVQEGCVLTGTRKLLRFDTVVINDGTLDFVVSAYTGPLPGRKKSNQWFEWGGCHGHHHLRDFTNYELLDADGDVVVVGRKQAFCLEDTAPLDPQNPGSGPKFTCGFQGITAGWSDVYGSFLDCQYLDVTGVPAGTYTLRVTIDHGDMVDETEGDDPLDNSASVTVTIP